MICVYLDLLGFMLDGDVVSSYARLLGSLAYSE